MIRLSETEASPWSDPPGIGRSMVIGCAIGVTLSMVVVVSGMLALGVETPSAIGLGLFVSFWGGLGFGTMFGGVAYATRIEAGLPPGRHVSPERVSTESAPTETAAGRAGEPAPQRLRPRTP